MSGSTKTKTPRAGDIVIYRLGRSTGIYVLSAFQHVSHLTFHTYDDAIRDAAAVAARDHVDAWYTPDGQQYQTVAAHRVEQRSFMPHRRGFVEDQRNHDRGAKDLLPRNKTRWMVLMLPPTEATMTDSPEPKATTATAEASS